MPRFQCVQALAALLSLALGALLLTRTAAAQNRPLPPVEELSYRPLSEALIRLQNATGIDLHYDPELVADKQTRTVKPQGGTPEDLLSALLEGTGLAFYQLSSGSYGIVLATPSGVPNGTLGGRVFDHATGIPLAGAHVVLSPPEQRGAATDTRGFFAFSSLPPGQYYVRVTHLGYGAHVDTVVVLPENHTDVQIRLIPQPIPITPITIEGFQGLDAPLQRGYSMTQDEFARVQGLGTADAIRGLNLAGVRVNNALADIHIQDSDPGEHQFRLDGVPIFEPVHLHGLIGAFNPFALDRITVYKAGFDVSEGSYLAGVIDAEHAVSSRDGRTVDVQVDPLSVNTRMNLQGRIREHSRGQFMAAYRRSLWSMTEEAGFWDLYRSDNLDTLLLRWNTPDQFLLRAALLILEERSPFDFRAIQNELDSLPPPRLPALGYSDVHAAGRLYLGRNNIFYLSYYRGGNRLDSRRLITALDTTDAPDDPPNPDKYRWVNENGQLLHTTLLGSHALLATRLRTSSYRYRHTYSALDTEGGQVYPIGGGVYVPLDLVPADDGNSIRETALETTFDYSGDLHDFQLGAELVRTAHRFNISDVFVRSITSEATTWHAALYLNNEVRLTSYLIAKGGLRLTYLQQQRHLFAEPRLEIRLGGRTDAGGSWAARAAAGVYRQYLNQFDMSSISPSSLFPSTRFWIPVDSSVTPPRAYHLAGDVVFRPSAGWTVRLETYYKHQPHLLQINYRDLWQLDEDLTRLDSIPPITTQSEFLRGSQGYAYGGAVELRHAHRLARSSLRYEYGVAKRDFVFQDSSRTLPVPWSEPHRLDLALDWTPHPRFIATARWRWSWGRLWGFRRAYYDYLGTSPLQIPTFGDVDFRDPTAPEHEIQPFRQLDVGAAYTIPIGPAALQVRVDVLNATDRKNVADRSLSPVKHDDEIVYVPEDRHLLRRTISLAMRLTW